MYKSNFLSNFAPANSRWGVCMDVTGEGADILKAFTKRLFLTFWNVGNFKATQRQVVVDARGVIIHKHVLGTFVFCISQRGFLHCLFGC